KLLDKIITSNPLGLLDLATKHNADYEDELSYLAFPDYPIGQIRVFDADCSILKDVCIISAYNEPLAALKFNTGGTKLATASEKGIVIKVFEVPSGLSQFIL
uniref:WD repeat domain phosphoinositide-interacting protein 2 n=1 Tax=Acrobeloides nanus TaxID=290746 RepID=A0A914DGV9_9BILA